MQHGIIEDSNLILRGDPEQRIHDLHARVEECDGYRVVTSAWFPSPNEMALLQAGQPVYVSLWLVPGSGFPPISVLVKS